MDTEISWVGIHKNSSRPIRGKATPRSITDNYTLTVVKDKHAKGRIVL